jgi:hypothetical protein
MSGRGITMLKPFRVSYFEEPGDKTKLFFYCWAEDSDHADEQAENAYPGCQLDITAEITDKDEIKHALGSLPV